MMLRFEEWEVSSEPVPESKNDASERRAETADKGGKELNLGPVRERTRPWASQARKPRGKLPRAERGEDLPLRKSSVQERWLCEGNCTSHDRRLSRE